MNAAVRPLPHTFTWCDADKAEGQLYLLPQDGVSRYKRSTIKQIVLLCDATLCVVQLPLYLWCLGSVHVRTKQKFAFPDAARKWGFTVRIENKPQQNWFCVRSA